MSDKEQYRRGVGVMLINDRKEVWVGRRIDNTDEAWQMPQGGIDKGEQPWPAALREVEEETGIRPHLIEQLSCHPQRLRYRLPEELIGVIWKEKWVGQEQDWFLARFLGTDDDVNIGTKTPEFSHWKWIEATHLPDIIVPFKRDLYRRLVEDFAPLM
ncbi:RNA pyrophosphohydrolase [Sphingomonas sp. HDW15A]|uniref:RNA pyrophosphohydrolase n=1 Tax=Sphingomonas sp. HDW15A TaxID=2714942 RepID=UPI00140DE570|nr:RNA pyrophosphohydrolase [Sphingomonas sp. HDW15A]QIK95489.1 RNA pyrophosphohydrolase [Sphingomonas sp. HDW15A]